MDLIGGLWHLLNFYAAALGIGIIASSATKLLWHRELKGSSWWRLWLWSSGSAAAVAVAGLVLFGHDGKMATYAAMVSACALSLWWVGFGPGREK
ncbi:hypothetical protein [Ideonella sp.]|uniref:hypothetical protein n=1 Tax=Ideonella sp. TaxID=1929293 RepID=UPI002B491476|nr:hypothetical protein [Ideonella sp.]HJV69400.1 hypothetical protein [Ideonella sp.]